MGLPTIAINAVLFIFFLSLSCQFQNFHYVVLTAAHIGVARVSNLVSTMKELKEKGFWLAGTDALAPPAAASNLTGPLVLCIGSEGEGLSRLVRQTCDFMVGIPLSGQTQSLNASCAAAILLYEASRQRALRSANQTE